MIADAAVRVKVCGLRRVQDAVAAAELGASAVGFIFWPGSARCVDAETARTISAAIPAHVLRVGVFVDQTPAHVADVAAHVGLAAVQLHGSESAEAYTGSGCEIIKAFGVTDAFDTTAVDALPAQVTVLLDAHDPVRRGGTGRTIDWSVAASVAGRRRTILSGGLTPENVREAVRRVRPWMVDVSSGVETAPGVKDAAKLRAFFEALAPSIDSSVLQDGD
jgi:phosphoribosylanthranilate isomerase